MILVTGGSGLVGSELVSQLLNQGYKVTAIYNTTPVPLSSPNLTTIQCDILDVIRLQEVMSGIKQVYHCAAVVAFDPAMRNHLFQVNVTGTANVVNAAIEAGVEKLVHVSSVAALGRIRDGEDISEDAVWTPKTSNSAYGKSKYLAEMEVWRATGEGLEVAIVNPSITLGGKDWNTGSSAIFKSAFDQFPWFTEGVSGFVGVKDVAAAMVLLMNSDVVNERFIISAENLAYKDLFSMIARAFGKRIPHKKVSPFMASLVWRIEALKSIFSGKKPLLTRETANTAQTKVYYNNKKFLDSFPSFTYTPISEVIREACATLKEKYHLM
jgi:dihydroflavonol-4-reductase